MHGLLDYLTDLTFDTVEPDIVQYSPTTVHKLSELETPLVLELHVHIIYQHLVDLSGWRDG